MGSFMRLPNRTGRPLPRGLALYLNPNIIPATIPRKRRPCAHPTNRAAPHSHHHGRVLRVRADRTARHTPQPDDPKLGVFELRPRVAARFMRLGPQPNSVLWNIDRLGLHLNAQVLGGRGAEI